MENLDIPVETIGFSTQMEGVPNFKRLNIIEAQDVIGNWNIKTDGIVQECIKALAPKESNKVYHIGRSQFRQIMQAYDYNFQKSQRLEIEFEGKITKLMNDLIMENNKHRIALLELQEENQRLENVTNKRSDHSKDTIKSLREKNEILKKRCSESDKMRSQLKGLKDQLENRWFYEKHPLLTLCIGGALVFLNWRYFKK